MSPVPAGHVWALSTTGEKRHVVIDGVSFCAAWLELGLSYNTPEIMAHEACKRCLVKTGGAE